MRAAGSPCRRRWFRWRRRRSLHRAIEDLASCLSCLRVARCRVHVSAGDMVSAAGGAAPNSLPADLVRTPDDRSLFYRTDRSTTLPVAMPPTSLPAACEAVFRTKAWGVDPSIRSAEACVARITPTRSPHTRGSARLLRAGCEIRGMSQEGQLKAATPNTKVVDCRGVRLRRAADHGRRLRVRRR